MQGSRGEEWGEGGRLPSSTRCIRVLLLNKVLLLRLLCLGLAITSIIYFSTTSLPSSRCLPENCCVPCPPGFSLMICDMPVDGGLYWEGGEGYLFLLSCRNHLPPLRSYSTGLIHAGSHKLINNSCDSILNFNV